MSTVSTSRWGWVVWGCLAILGPGCEAADSGMPPGPEGFVIDAVELTAAANGFGGLDLQIDSQVLTASSNVDIDWGSLTSDWFGEALHPEQDVVTVGVSLLRSLTPEEALENLAGGQLEASDVVLYGFHAPTATHCQLNDFELLGHPLTLDSYFVEQGGTWVVDILGEERPLASLFLVPLADSDQTVASFQDGCSDLGATLDLSTVEPIAIAGSDTEYLTWSELALDPQRHAPEMPDIDTVELLRFDDLTTSDLEDMYFELAFEADGWWQADVAGRSSMGFDELRDEDGIPPDLRSFDDDATWLLVLRCVLCNLPIAPFVGVVDVGS